MTTLWTAYEAAIATGGYITTGSWKATGISIDSRTVKVGDLFFALRGTRYDGHNFVKMALKNGAVAAVVDYSPLDVNSEFLLQGNNTEIALRELARQARSRSRALVVAITGSVGKTGTKEMLKRALSVYGNVYATEGNLNNRYGVPLTLARVPTTTSFTILEMGISHPGELTPLSYLSKPDIAIITAVEEAHLEFFSSVTAISDAKGEIFSGMNTQSIVILNHDCFSFERLLSQAFDCGISRIYRFGTNEEAEFRLCDYSIVDGGMVVNATIFGKPLTYKIGIYGYHWALNSLSVIAAVFALGGHLQRAINTLGKPLNLPGRGTRKKLTTIHGDIEIIDESYNANPASVKAALAVLGAAQISPHGRRIAILGDMLELGPESEILHIDLVKVILKQDVHLVFTVGPLMAHLYQSLPYEKRGSCATNVISLIDIIKAALQPGDIVLVKGSAGSKVSVIVTALQATTF